jgi:predicted Zn-dependent peptidase
VGIALVGRATERDAERVIPSLAAVVPEAPPQSRPVPAAPAGNVTEAPISGRRAYLVRGFVLPAARPEEDAAARVLIAALAGKSGTLFRSLRQSEPPVYEFGAIAEPGARTLLLLIQAAIAVEPPATPDDRVSALDRGVARALEGLPLALDDAGVARARAVALEQWWESQDSLLGRADALALAEAGGRGYDSLLRMPEAIASVTQEEVLALAKSLRSPDVVVRLWPRPSADQASPSAPVDRRARASAAGSSAR